MKNVLKLLLTVGLLVAVSSCGEQQGDGSGTAGAGQPLNFATLGVGSSWYVYGATIADVAGKADPALSFNVLPNSGGVGNLLLLQNGKADIGLGFNNVNSWGLQGAMAFAESGAIPELRGLVASLDQMYVGIAMRDGAGFSSVREIAVNKTPVRLLTANKGSASEYSTRVVLESVGLTYDDIIAFGGTVEHTDFASIVQAFKDGKCDLFMQNISVGHASFTELAVSVAVTMEALDDQSMDYMVSRGYSVEIMPADSFNGQNVDLRSAGITTCLVTTESLDEDTAYRITKAVYENKAGLAEGHQGLASFNQDMAANETIMGLPLHPGAMKYYKEIGLIE